MFQLTKRTSVSILTLMFFVSGCTVHHITDYSPPVPVPDAFLNDQPGVGNICEWWREFNQPDLDELVEQALVNNMDIRQAWSRLDQARATLCIARSALYPQINLSADVQYNSVIDRRRDVNESEVDYLLRPTLSYEVDLWRKIDSAVKSAQLQTQVSWEDLEGTALVLSGAVTDIWFVIQEQQALIKLILYQIKVSETLLEIVELRFSIGEASALDVYQQRLQTEEVKLQLIPVENRLHTATYELHVLLGIPPEEKMCTELELERILLPEFPNLGTPSDLLCRRPDLRAAYFNLESADYEVAVAVANLFPQLSLDFSYLFIADNIGDLFKNQIGRLGANIFQPVFDGFRRACEVRRREAIVNERISEFGAIFLTALSEVEIAIVTERSQIRLIEQIDKEIQISKLYLDEARIRYSRGLNDYLQVINAIQSLQALQRRGVRENTILLTNRSKLYRALGGSCIIRCQDRAPNFEIAECVEEYEF